MNKRRRWTSRVVLFLLLAAGLTAAGWYGFHAWERFTAPKQEAIPTARVHRGDVSLAVTARGELRGGNADMLTAPMTGGSDMHLTSLRTSGDVVKAGDVVAEFDTTEQEYKLREAEADLAEAEQHVLQAQSNRDAQEEEDRYALLKVQNDLKLAELEVRKNPLLPVLTARVNTLTLDAARDHLTQLQKNLANRKSTGDSAIAIQEAGRAKAESQAKTAKQNIEAMVLRAKRDGYVSIRQNTSTNMSYQGMKLPLFQQGDPVNPGMAVAEIPDLKNWEISGNLGELDRGHLVIGQKVDVSMVALPGQKFRGTVKNIGGTAGPSWDRRFECRISLDNPTPDLRPGMSVNIVITTDELHQVLSLPAQALFTSDGRTFVYVKTAAGFAQKDVTLVRRNEARVVISGLEENQEVALANPADTGAKKAAPGSALKSLGK